MNLIRRKPHKPEAFPSPGYRTCPLTAEDIAKRGGDCPICLKPLAEPFALRAGHVRIVSWIPPIDGFHDRTGCTASAEVHRRALNFEQLGGLEADARKMVGELKKLRRLLEDWPSAIDVLGESIVDDVDEAIAMLPILDAAYQKAITHASTDEEGSRVVALHDDLKRRTANLTTRYANAKPAIDARVLERKALIALGKLAPVEVPEPAMLVGAAIVRPIEEVPGTFRVRQTFTDHARTFRPGEIVERPRWRNYRAMLESFYIEKMS